MDFDSKTQAHQQSPPAGNELHESAIGKTNYQTYLAGVVGALYYHIRKPSIGIDRAENFNHGF